MTGWALVTGASGDIGSVIAERLAGDGYDLVLHTFRRKQAADSLAERIGKHGRQVLVIPASLAATGATERFADQVAEAIGGVTAMVAAAALTTMKPRYDLWLLQRYALPALYWNLMLNGRV